MLCYKLDIILHITSKSTHISLVSSILGLPNPIPKDIMLTVFEYQVQLIIKMMRTNSGSEAFKFSKRKTEN